MLVKSFGCSFVYGTDLSDDGRGQLFAKPSKLTWPSLIANQRQWDYQCFARPGAGNLQILERLLSALATSQDCFWIVGWTWIDRFDYTLGPRDQWHTLMPIDTDTVTLNYYKNLHSQFRDKLVTLTYIKLAIDALKQKQQPFLMTYMDDLIFETKWHCTPAIADLQQCVKPFLYNWQGKNFVDWSRDRGFEISATLHPLEAAHASAAEYFNQFVNLSNKDHV